jgi:hypothetical protein
LIDYFHFFRERNKNGRETILENCGEEDWGSWRRGRWDGVGSVNFIIVDQL